MRALSLGAATLLAWLVPAEAQITPPTTILIIAPWTPAAPGGAETAAAYFTLENKGNMPDRLLAAATPEARSAALIAAENLNGVHAQRPVAAVDLPPGAQAVFSPGGYHIALKGLTRPLKEGMSFPLTLTFAKAGEITVAVEVRALDAAGGGTSGKPQESGGGKSE